MADLSVTAATVRSAEDEANNTTWVQFGEAVTPGQVVYLKAGDSKYWKAANTTEAEAAAKGISLSYADADGYGTIQVGGDINPGATVAVGEVYCASDNSGGIAPVGDLDQYDFVTTLGIGTTASNLNLNIHASGVQHA